MRLLRILGIAVAIVLILVLVIAFFLPATFSVERSAYCLSQG